jgi:iron complex outermembrane receptor protein
MDAAFIAKSGIQNLPDLLEKKANIGIRTLNGNPLQSQISMRGFGENSFGRIKILFDGEELNNVDMFAPNLSRISLGAVKRVEIIKTPSPVLYGDGAVAGVINILSDLPENDGETRITARGGSYGAAGATILSRGSISEENISYSAAYDYTRCDGYRRRSAYDIHTFDTSLRKTFENQSFFGVKANYANAFYEMPGALTRAAWQADRKAAGYNNDWCRTWNNGFGFESKAKLAEDQWLYLDGRFSMQYRRSNWGDYNYANDYTLYGFFISPRYVNEVGIGDFDNTLTIGTDWRYDRYNVEDRSGFNNPKYHFDRFRAALFANNEFALTDKLSLTAGARAENIDNRWTHYQGLSDPKSSQWKGDFELGVVYCAFEGMKSYVKGTRFHRSPFCDEMNYTQNGQLLKPETGTSLDAGIEWDFLQEYSFMFNAYGMIMDDEIFYNPYVTPGLYGWNGYNCNSPSKTKRLGFDTGFAWRRDKCAEASVSYSALQAYFDNGQYHGCDVPLVPNHRIRAEAGVWILNDLEIKGGYRFVSSQRLMGDFGNDHTELAGYSLFDISLYYEPSWAQGWSASATVDNLLNRNYCDFAGWSDWSQDYYYPASGRTFLISISYKF